MLKNEYIIVKSEFDNAKTELLNAENNVKNIYNSSPSKTLFNINTIDHIISSREPYILGFATAHFNEIIPALKKKYNDEIEKGASKLSAMQTVFSDYSNPVFSDETNLNKISSCIREFYHFRTVILPINYQHYYRDKLINDANYLSSIDYDIRYIVYDIFYKTISMIFFLTVIRSCLHEDNKEVLLDKLLSGNTYEMSIKEILDLHIIEPIEQLYGLSILSDAKTALTTAQNNLKISENALKEKETALNTANSEVNTITKKIEDLTSQVNTLQGLGVV